MHVLISARRKRGLPRVSVRIVRQWANRMLASLELPSAELSVHLTDDTDIHELNRVYRSRDEPTDVLAFAMREGEKMPDSSDQQILGDVVISLETADRQAKKRGCDLDSEVMTLLAHGLLHLLGHDHRNAVEMRLMRARTRRLCTAAQSGTVRG
jgi:probable rRNA maturation factor